MHLTSSEKAVCCFCHLPRAELGCDSCSEPVCRSCVHRLHEDTFLMLAQVPKELSHTDYCPNCHDNNVAPALEKYNEVLEKAKGVHFWPKTYRGHIPILKKGRVEIVVAEGRDRNEVLLKLGFLAAEQGFNGLTRGELFSKKVRNHGYQKMVWSGKGFPVTVDEGKLERAEFREAHWRVLHHR